MTDYGSKASTQNYGAELPSFALFGGYRAFGHRMRMELDHGYFTVAGLNRAAKIVADDEDDVGWIIEIVVYFQTSVCCI